MKLLVLCTALFFSVIADNERDDQSIKRKSASSLAKATYLIRSGWLVQTENHLMLFDYVPYGGINLDDFVRNEFSIAEKNKKQLVIFISHEHDDHFYPKLLEWSKQFPNLKIVLGWDYESSQPGVYKLSGRDEKMIDKIKVAVHPSTDAGSGFLISVDNIVIYHAGDHAQWAPSLKSDFIKETNYIKEKATKIDLAFVPVEIRREIVMEGAVTATKILNPDYVFPMHSKFEDYRIYSDKIKSFVPAARTFYPKQSKDVFTIN